MREIISSFIYVSNGRQFQQACCFEFDKIPKSFVTTKKSICKTIFWNSSLSCNVAALEHLTVDDVNPVLGKYNHSTRVKSEWNMQSEITLIFTNYGHQHSGISNGDLNIAGEELQNLGLRPLTGRGLYRATSSVTRSLDLFSLNRRTAPFNRLIR